MDRKVADVDPALISVLKDGRICVVGFSGRQSRVVCGVCWNKGVLRKISCGSSSSSRGRKLGLCSTHKGQREHAAARAKRAALLDETGCGANEDPI